MHVAAQVKSLVVVGQLVVGLPLTATQMLEVLVIFVIFVWKYLSKMLVVVSGVQSFGVVVVVVVEGVVSIVDIVADFVVVVT
mgnify:CR=1 FL=1